VKKLFISAALLVLLVSAAVAQEKTYDLPNEFSFKYSDGWNKGARKGGVAGELDWLVSTADPSATFHPVVAHADFNYDDWLHRTIHQASPERSLASKTEFATADGEKGYKLVWNIKGANGQQFVSYNYLFHGKGGSQLQFSGLVDAANATKFEPLYDNFAKSVVIAK
jgi:hypothetical protein